MVPDPTAWPSRPTACARSRIGRRFRFPETHRTSRHAPDVAGFAAACAVLVLSSAGSAAAFELTSSDLKPNATIDEKHVYNGFGCTGDNLSPALSWKNPPKG